MNCEELMAIVNNYVDGQIDPSVCQAFELPQEFQSCLQSALHEHWEKLHGKKADSD
jgi:hypothetical protein